ncbi:MAG: HAMP domain-containing histidine kinase [Rhodospirillaceae bacterium]|nr:MAG: HAMP domain-containing histidine kinase [Rhodospirillaceae bacterium]
MNRASITKLLNVFGSTTFRLVLAYTLIFSLSVGGLFYFVFWTTAQFAEQQIEAAITADVTGFQDAFARAGVPGLVMAINRRVEPDLRGDGVYVLVDSVGNPVAGNMRRWPQQVVPDDVWVTFTVTDPSRVTDKVGDVRALQFVVPGGFRLLVGRDIRDARRFRAQLIHSLDIGLAITAALGLIGGFIFSRTIMRRIESITRTCRRIMSGDLSQRVPVARTTDEFGRLALSINAMLDQIERLMRSMQQVSDNVAHDLRTPLTRLRSRLESALRHMDDPANREAVEGAVADADSLLATFAALLRIARAEAGSQRNFVDLDLVAITEDVADLYGPLAEEKGLTFASDIKPGLRARGDRNLVAQALANLVDNAIKYTETGSVTIAANERDGRAMLVVADTGPGIADAYKDKVLERLVRLEQSRTSPGSGLGLSLVAAVAKSHGLDLVLKDNNPGLRVELAFPRIEATVKATPPPMVPPAEKDAAPRQVAAE